MSLQSIDFHERGKNHKENVAAKISEVLICGKIPTISMHHVSVSCFYFRFLEMVDQSHDHQGDWNYITCQTHFFPTGISIYPKSDTLHVKK